MNTTIQRDNEFNQNEASSFYESDLSITLDDGDFFLLDAMAAKSLDIIPNPKQQQLSSRKSASVYSVLNNCRTLCGQKLLMYWIKRPLVSKSRIEKRQNIVNFFVKDSALRQTCSEVYLKKMPDLIKIGNNFSKRKATLMDLVKVDRARNAVMNILERITESDIELNSNVEELVEGIKTAVDNLQTFSELVNSTIDVNRMDPDGNFMIRGDFDEGVARISLEISNKETEARRLMKSVAEDLDLEYDKSLKLETDLVIGFGLKVTRKQEQVLRGRDKYTLLTNAKKDGVRFTFKALSHLSDDYISLHKEYNTVAEEITKQILETATGHEDPVRTLGVLIAIIDVFVAMSLASFRNDYVKPQILDQSEGTIHIERMRHPCLENQPDVENYVANDIMFNKDDKKFYIITGPNMGGKSTFIKSVAISVLMAQVGCNVPASQAMISIVDGIYTRIGAGDRQLQGISTFMDEMLDMAEILNKSTCNSLVIIDELGRGTSTFEGFGLAWSLSERLAKEIKSYTLFATHFHELTDLAKEIATVGNLNILAYCDKDKLTMLYSVEHGVCKESYGINVARFTDFPQHIVDVAQEKLRQYEEIPGFKSKEDVHSCVKKIIEKVKERDLKQTA